MTDEERDAVMQELSNLRTVVSDALANRCVQYVLARVALQGRVKELEGEVKPDADK